MAHIYEKGIVVIPKLIRELAGVYPGAEIDFRVVGNEIVVFPKKKSISGLEKLWAEAESGKGATDVETERDIVRLKHKRRRMLMERLDVR